jgi:hypothetical protein
MVRAFVQCSGRGAPAGAQAVRLSIRPMSVLPINASMSIRISMRSATEPMPVFR